MTLAATARHTFNCGIADNPASVANGEVTPQAAWNGDAAHTVVLSGTLDPTQIDLTATYPWTGLHSWAQGALTASAPLTYTQTWNHAGVTFTGYLWNVTNTASAAASKIFDFQRQNTSLLWLGTNGAGNTTLALSGFTNSQGAGHRISNNNGAAQYNVDASGNTQIRNESSGKAIIFELSAEVARFLATTGHLQFALGKAPAFAAGSNQRAGNATLVGGTIAVANTTVTANTVVILTRKTAGGTLGNLTYTLSAGVSFTINSDSVTDTSTVSYFLMEVA